MFRRRRFGFDKPDPLGAGIREEIKRQRNNPESYIDIFERPTGEQLQDYLKQLMAVEIGSTALSSAGITSVSKLELQKQ